MQTFTNLKVGSNVGLYLYVSVTKATVRAARVIRGQGQGQASVLVFSIVRKGYLGIELYCDP